LPPDVVPGNAPQKVTGAVTCPFKGATGFTQPGDSAAYSMDVRTAGAYRISIKGTGLDHCAPLTVEIGGRKLPPAKTTAESIEFGEVELSNDLMDLRVTAGVPPEGAKPATVQEIAVAPTTPIPAASADR
jgi:hypothetical protein